MFIDDYRFVDTTSTYHQNNDVALMNICRSTYMSKYKQNLYLHFWSTTNTCTITPVNWEFEMESYAVI